MRKYKIAVAKKKVEMAPFDTLNVLKRLEEFLGL